MAKSRGSRDAMGNGLLDRLPPAERRRLGAACEVVGLPFRKVLYPAGGVVDYVYFPTHGVISTVAVAAGQRSIEVGMCGREGIVGSQTALGDPTSAFLVQVQVAGEGMRIGLRSFHAAAAAGTALNRVLARYQAVLWAVTAQSAACNGLHMVSQRCCRWLLMVQDRMQADSFHLTHDFLGTMLGVRRASVTEVLNLLQADGLVSYGRGEMAVLDRPGLERASCHCYEFGQGQFDRLIP